MDTEETTSKDNPPQGDTVNSAGIQLENTAIQEYLDIVRKEYDIEREKRQAYENRIGIILSLLSVACFFYFQYISPKDISVLFTQELTFLLLIKILPGILIYVSMMAGMVLSVVVISTKKQKRLLWMQYRMQCWRSRG